MAKVINIIGEGSNVGKTVLIEGLIRELKSRGASVATVKHDVHGFDIDKKGKDTYRHRESGAETVIISSKNRLAMIKGLREEYKLEEIIKLVNDKDVILVEGYKNSFLRKIEVFRSGFSKDIITSKERLIAIASDKQISFEGIIVVNKNNYEKLADLIEAEEEYIF